MKELLRQERRDLFETPYMELAISFLYKNYSRKIQQILLPSYLVHILVMALYLLVVEANRDDARLNTEVDQFMLSLQEILTIGMGVINLINLYFFLN